MILPLAVPAVSPWLKNPFSDLYMNEQTLPPDINRRVESMIRIGTIAEVDHPAGKCRVQTGKLLTEWIPWFERREGTTRDWDPPTPGEQCMVLSPSGDPAGGLVLLGIPSDAHPQPTHDKNFWMRVFPDGAVLQHNHAEHRFQIKVGSASLTLMPGMAILKTPFFLVDAPLTQFTGTVQIGRTLHISDTLIVDSHAIIGGKQIVVGEQIGRGGNSNRHVHVVSGVASGDDKTATLPPYPPQPTEPES
ncbi:hypothetical protein AGMMS50256_11520 [Betaproteobacteria bacterium]|nr:hypothetical protein AGMMS50256_11520 [Betaproteobacteria bacterium]